MFRHLHKTSLKIIAIVVLTVLMAIAPVFFATPASQAQAGTTMQQEDTKPVSRYAFERVQGEVAEPSQNGDGLPDIKSVRELREKITKPVYSKTAGAGASDNSGQLDNSIQDYESQAKQRVKHTVDNLSH